MSKRKATKKGAVDMATPPSSPRCPLAGEIEFVIIDASTDRVIEAGRATIDKGMLIRAKPKRARKRDSA